MKHFASPNYWFHYRQLPEEIQELANKKFDLLKADPRHPSLRLKKTEDFGQFESASITGRWRKSGPMALCGFGSDLMMSTIALRN